MDSTDAIWSVTAVYYGDKKIKAKFTDDRKFISSSVIVDTYVKKLIDTQVQLAPLLFFPVIECQTVTIEDASSIATAFFFALNSIYEKTPDELIFYGKDFLAFGMELDSIKTHEGHDVLDALNHGSISISMATQPQF